MRRIGPVVVLLCIAATAWSGDEQRVAPAPAPLTFSAEAELVNLTVTVRDAKGQLVGDLTPDDFEILEDGRPQRVALFSPAMTEGENESLALDLGLLLDTSESMAKELRLTQEAATRFLEAIPRARDLLTVFFDQDIRVSRYDTEHQQGLFERIMGARASGNTALYDAIAVYLSRVQDSGGRKVLVLLTDGEDTTSELSLDQVIHLVKSSSVTIYSIAFPGEYGHGTSRYAAARAFLGFLAQQTGGQVFSPTDSRDLPTIYERILDELSSQYVIGFTSDNSERDGKYRRLRVDVKRKDLRVHARAGYFAPKG